MLVQFLMFYVGRDMRNEVVILTISHIPSLSYLIWNSVKIPVWKCSIWTFTAVWVCNKICSTVELKEKLQSKIVRGMLATHFKKSWDRTNKNIIATSHLWSRVCHSKIIYRVVDAWTGYPPVAASVHSLDVRCLYTFNLSCRKWSILCRVCPGLIQIWALTKRPSGGGVASTASGNWSVPPLYTVLAIHLPHVSPTQEGTPPI